MRRNPDEELRHWQRAGHYDPQAYRKYLQRLVRTGQPLPIEDYYQEEIRPYGIAEADFKIIIELLVQKTYWLQHTDRPRIYRDRENLTPSGSTRDWAWLCTYPLQQTSNIDVAACLLAVRGYTRDISSARIFDPHFTIGITTYETQDLTLQTDVLHPRNAWYEELAETPWIYRSRPRITIPTFYYTSAERSYDLPAPQTISHIDKPEWAHGCEVRGPGPCHVDLPHGVMMRWARQEAPDRQVFSVYEGRLYVGLDPETGRPYDYRGT